jgi:cell division protein ZapE
MKRLFSEIFDLGCVMVATSNRPPEDLYLDGLNRPLFLPFIDLLKERCEIHNLDKEGGKDYRMKTKLLPFMWNHPLNETSRKHLLDFFHTLTETRNGSSKDISVMMGRKLHVPFFHGKKKKKKKLFNFNFFLISLFSFFFFFNRASVQVHFS